MKIFTQTLFSTALLLGLMSPFVSEAQNAHWCKAEEVTIAKLQETGGVAQFENDYQEMLEAGRAYGEQGGSRAVRTVPVVVHVVYNNSSENVSDNLINGMVQTMNEDFRRTNPDASQTRAQFVGVAADSEIEFCLATIDPNGSATTGITRTFTSKSNFDSDTETDDMKQGSLGGKDAWNTLQYLNVWVVDIAPGSGGLNTIGYAYLPTGGAVGSWYDGFVIDYDYVGYGQRTATHEIGHYFGLRHPWGAQESCNFDDGFADTPTSDGPNFGCDLNAASCGSTDQIENFMDYSSCDNMYSDDQANLMNATLSGVRSGLLSSPGCNNPNYTIPTSANGTTEGDFIDGVVLETISNLSTGGVGSATYKNYTNQTTNLALSGAYTVSVTSGSWPAGFPDYYAVWIDWNQDKDFNDADEKLGEFVSTANFTAQDITFTVPLSAASGTTRMRVRGVWDQNSNINPDQSYDWGETEDYSVVVIDAIPPVAAFSVSADTILVGQSVDFVDLSTNNPTIWNWNFIGSDSISEVQNVFGFVYTEPGCHDVFLQVANAGGGGSLYGDCVVYVKDTNEFGWPTDIEEQLSLQDRLAVYPNPTRDLLVVEWKGNAWAPYKMQIVDALGRSIISGSLTGTSTRMSLADLPDGMYFLRVETQDGVIVKRVQHLH